MCQDSDNDTPRCGAVMCPAEAGVADCSLQPSPCLGSPLLLLLSTARGFYRIPSGDRTGGRVTITAFSHLDEISLPKKNLTLSERTGIKTKPESRGVLYGLHPWSCPLRITDPPPPPKCLHPLPSSPPWRGYWSFNHQTKPCHVAPEDTVWTGKNKTQESQ